LRAKQSFTATEIYSSTEKITPLTIRAGAPGLPGWRANSFDTPHTLFLSEADDLRPAVAAPASLEGEALLHDARNLIGTLGLYCDLLSMPGVLKHEHRQYADDLRLVGTRSGALIERLIHQLVQAADQPAAGRAADAPDFPADPVEVLPVLKPASLRRIVERCSGLLSRVAGGRAIEVNYGEAAAVPVAVADEVVERILVNLVRNAAAALCDRRASSEAAEQGECVCGAVTTGTELPAPIRIGVGVLANRVGDLKPWPFRRVRLTVEDSGRGMSQQQLEALVCAITPPSRRGTHGIGFRVVQQLVSYSGGDLRVMSAPGVGTCVQIEWPMAAGVATAPVTERWTSC